MSRDNDSAFALGWDHSTPAPMKKPERPLLVIAEDDTRILAVAARYELRRCDNGASMAVCPDGPTAIRTLLLFRSTRGAPLCEIVDLATGRIVVLDGDF